MNCQDKGRCNDDDLDPPPEPRRLGYREVLKQYNAPRVRT